MLIIDGKTEDSEGMLGETGWELPPLLPAAQTQAMAPAVAAAPVQQVRRFAVSGSRADRCAAGCAGGAVAFVSSEEITSDVDWLVESTRITGSTVSNGKGGSVFGGGVHFGFAGDAVRVNVTVRGGEVTGSRLECSSTDGGVCLVGGGGVNVRYDKAATDVQTRVAGACAYCFMSRVLTHTHCTIACVHICERPLTTIPRSVCLCVHLCM